MLLVIYLVAIKLYYLRIVELAKQLLVASIKFVAC